MIMYFSIIWLNLIYTGSKIDEDENCVFDCDPVKGAFIHRLNSTKEMKLLSENKSIKIIGIFFDSIFQNELPFNYWRIFNNPEKFYSSLKSLEISEKDPSSILRKIDKPYEYELDYTIQVKVDPKLNLEQKKAVQLGCSLKESVGIIHGPPGTGKTEVIVEIVKHYIELGKKVLVLSETNIAVENMIEKIGKEHTVNVFFDIGKKAKEKKKKGGVLEKLYLDKSEEETEIDLKIVLNEKVKTIKNKLRNKFEITEEEETEFLRFANVLKEFIKKKYEKMKDDFKTETYLKKMQNYLIEIERLKKLCRKKIVGADIELKSLIKPKWEVLTSIVLVPSSFQTIAHLFDNLSELKTKRPTHYHRLKEIINSDLENFETNILNVSDVILKYKTLIDFISNIEQTVEENNFELIGVKNADVIGATIGRAAKASKYYKKDYKFVPDLIIIDEASKSKIEDLLWVFCHETSVLLIGDEKQLPPMTSSEFSAKLTPLEKEFYQKSLFSYFNQYLPPFLKVEFIKTFRLPLEIVGLVSELIYENKLQSSFIARNNSKYTEISLNNALYFHNSSGNERRTPNSTSLSNIHEAETIFNWVYTNYAFLENQFKKERNTRIVSIISPYKSQKELIESKIEEARLFSDWLSVDTVDSIQGYEADIVLFSAVRSRPQEGFKKPHINPFYANLNRLNVAITRAKYHFILFGNRQYLEKSLTEQYDRMPILYQVYMLCKNRETSGGSKTS